MYFSIFFNITWLVVILNNILPQFVKGCQNWRNYDKLAQKLPQLFFWKCVKMCKYIPIFSIFFENLENIFPKG